MDSPLRGRPGAEAMVRTLPIDATGARPPPAAKKPRGLRQTMSDLHIWTGLLVGWILYAMFLTGTVSFYRDELSAYMRPELPQMAALPAPADVAQRVADDILRQTPGSPQINITLPTSRSPTASAFWRDPGGGRRGFSTGVFDPNTGGRAEARATQGGDFFFAFHFNLHYMPAIWGRWIAGFCAMFMLVAIISGVITHKKIFTDFFTFRSGKGQRSWLDAHNALSVLGLPFHFMITWSGLVTLMLIYMPWGMQTLAPPDRAAVLSEMRFMVPPTKPAGMAAPMLPLAPYVLAGEQRWGPGGVGSVQIANAGDANARVAVVRQRAQRVSTAPQFLVFNAVDGKLLDEKHEAGAAATTQGVLYGLHLGRFADLTMRFLYFLVSLAGTAMVGTGLVLWTVKRRTKLPDPERPHFGFRLVERLNIATIAGLSTAMAGMLWANRLLPIELPRRAEWEVDILFLIWGASLLWSLVRPARRAWIELLWLAALALALLPVLNALTTDRPLWRSLAEGDWVFGGVEIGLLVLALGHAMLARRTMRHSTRTPSGRAPRAARRAETVGEPTP